MADWKVIGGITALGGIIGFFGAKTVDSRKLPAGEKAVLTGASTGATMEGLEALMAAESPSPLTWPPETGCEHCKYYYKKGRDVCSACDFYFEFEADSFSENKNPCPNCGKEFPSYWQMGWVYEKQPFCDCGFEGELIRDAESYDFSQKSAESFSAGQKGYKQVTSRRE